jgi:hypothetical protein
MVLLGSLEPLLHEIDLRIRSGDSLLRLLLKSMKHVDRIREAHGVHRPVGVAIVLLDDLQDPSPLKPLRGFASACLPPV